MTADVANGRDGFVRMGSQAGDKRGLQAAGKRTMKSAFANNIPASVLALYPRGVQKTLAVLETYLDESGFNRSDARVMAGYIASARQWDKFTSAWKGMQQKFHAPLFHARRFFNPKAFQHDYPGWSDKDKQLYMQAVIRIVKQHRLNPIRISVHVRGFSLMDENERRYVTGGIYKAGRWIRQGAPSKPYFLALIGCVSRALGFTPTNMSVHFYLDKQNEFAANVLELYSEIRKNFFAVDDLRLGGIAFSTRSQTPALELADLIAYLSLQQAIQEVSELETLCLANILPKKHMGLGMITAPSFAAMRERFQKALKGIER